MSVVTAQIIAGTGDLYRPGVRPLNVLWFAEGGGRPSWLLERSGWLDFIEPGRDRGGDGVGPREPVLLVPESPETILEDGLLLLVARGIEDPAVVARSRHLVPELLDSSHVELDSGKHNPDDLVEMRELSAECEMSCQLTSSRFRATCSTTSYRSSRTTRSTSRCAHRPSRDSATRGTRRGNASGHFKRGHRALPPNDPQPHDGKGHRISTLTHISRTRRAPYAHRRGDRRRWRRAAPASSAS